jgi:hypothetical protein
MNSIVSRYASTSAIAYKDLESESVDEAGYSMWGSTGGLAVGPSGVPTFAIPRVPDVSNSASPQRSTY